MVGALQSIRDLRDGRRRAAARDGSRLCAGAEFECPAPRRRAPHLTGVAASRTSLTKSDAAALWHTVVVADKVLLITGASRGIGAATARLAAQRGYAVAVNYLENR